MTTKLTVHEAVEVLKKLGRNVTTDAPIPSDRMVRAALAALDGITIYGSRFKVGDEVYVLFNDSIVVDGGKWNIQQVMITRVDQCFHERMFPTREEAEAECRKRNEAK